MSTLEIKDVSYAYEKGKTILSHVNAVFETGKLYAILGPSGSGKTAFLSLAGGLDSPAAGEILLDNEPVGARGLEYHRRTNVSLIFQSYNLIDYMTSAENVRLTAKQEPLAILGRLGLTIEDSKKKCAKAFRRTAAACGHCQGFGFGYADNFGGRAYGESG